ncbi:hypothetical protein VP01_717g1 [Puccinia sorghi]|uniref:Uncharacterized protein n=1 Tax=Puccinia sorghi TaxID=27349 RepID=A0A0L6UDC3_9BASI|nr:hypothetical protein VP01_717g1 [Puccinia sorghi]
MDKGKHSLRMGGGRDHAFVPFNSIISFCPFIKSTCLSGNRTHKIGVFKLVLFLRKKATEGEEEQAGMTDSSGYNQQRVLVGASGQGSSRGNGLLNVEKPQEKQERREKFEKDRKQASSFGVVETTNSADRSEQKENITRNMTYWFKFFTEFCFQNWNSLLIKLENLRHTTPSHYPSCLVHGLKNKKYQKIIIFYCLLYQKTILHVTCYQVTYQGPFEKVTLVCSWLQLRSSRRLLGRAVGTLVHVMTPCWTSCQGLYSSKSWCPRNDMYFFKAPCEQPLVHASNLRTLHLWFKDSSSKLVVKIAQAWGQEHLRVPLRRPNCLLIELAYFQQGTLGPRKQLPSFGQKTPMLQTSILVFVQPIPSCSMGIVSVNIQKFSQNNRKKRKIILVIHNTKAIWENFQAPKISLSSIFQVDYMFLNMSYDPLIALKNNSWRIDKTDERCVHVFWAKYYYLWCTRWSDWLHGSHINVGWGNISHQLPCKTPKLNLELVGPLEKPTSAKLWEDQCCTLWLGFGCCHLWEFTGRSVEAVFPTIALENGVMGKKPQKTLASIKLSQNHCADIYSRHWSLNAVIYTLVMVKTILYYFWTITETAESFIRLWDDQSKEEDDTHSMGPNTSDGASMDTSYPEQEWVQLNNDALLDFESSLFPYLPGLIKFPSIDVFDKSNRQADSSVNKTVALQEELAQLPSVEMQHAAAKLPSKLHMFAYVDVLAQSLWTPKNFLDFSHVNCRQLSKFFFSVNRIFLSYYGSRTAHRIYLHKFFGYFSPPVSREDPNSTCLHIYIGFGTVTVHQSLVESL